MGKTQLSLFSSFSVDELCQLYVFPSTPNTNICNNYYRITDRDVLSSYYKFKVRGTVVESDISCMKIFDDERAKKNYCTDKNKKPIRGLARDVMWKFSNWFNKDLQKWIKIQKPTCIVLMPGEAKFIYKMALKIANLYKLPLLVYICDEYYFVKQPSDILSKIKLKMLQKTIKNTISYSSHIVTICDELNRLYSNGFKKATTTLMTGSSIPPINHSKLEKLPSFMNYFGNISINRNISIADIGQIIDEINEEKSTNYLLNIYTAETNQDILKVFDGIACIKVHKFLSGDEYKKVFIRSEALLHVEAFDEDSIDRVKNSISTKIADSLGSGIPLFAYGPENVASIGHLRRNKCAICAISRGELKDQLLRLFQDIQYCSEIVNNALEVTEKMHNESKNSNELHKILESIQ